MPQFLTTPLMITASFGQAAALFACAVTSTHGGFLQATVTVCSLRWPTRSQSFVAMATTVHGTFWPAVQAGITVDFE